MEVVGAVASVSQLIAYSKSAVLVLRGLYKDLRKHPLEWGKQATELDLLLHILERFARRHHSDSEALPGAVLLLLLDLSAIAQSARALVASAQSAGLWGVRWAAFRAARDLPDVLKSLQSKRKLLQLFISEHNLEISSAIRDNMSSKNTREEFAATDSDQMVERKGNIRMTADQTGANNLNSSNNGWESFLREKVSDVSGFEVSAKQSGNGNVSKCNNPTDGISEAGMLESQRISQKAEKDKTGVKTTRSLRQVSFQGQEHVQGTKPV